MFLIKQGWEKHPKKQNQRRGFYPGRILKSIFPCSFITTNLKVEYLPPTILLTSAIFVVTIFRPFYNICHDIMHSKEALSCSPVSIQRNRRIVILPSYRDPLGNPEAAAVQPGRNLLTILMPCSSSAASATGQWGSF